MNGAVSCLAYRKELQGAVQNGRFRQKEANKEVILANSGLFQARSPSLRKGGGLSDGLPH